MTNGRRGRRSHVGGSPFLFLCLVTSLLGPVYRLFVVLDRCEDGVKDERVETEIEEGSIVTIKTRRGPQKIHLRLVPTGAITRSPAVTFFSSPRCRS